MLSRPDRRDAHYDVEESGKRHSGAKGPEGCKGTGKLGEFDLTELNGRWPGVCQWTVQARSRFDQAIEPGQRQTLTGGVRSLPVTGPVQ